MWVVSVKADDTPGARVSKKKAGPEYAEQHELSDSGLQVVSGASFQDPYEVLCYSSTIYALPLTT